MLAQRALGIDVSAWQGTISWATVAKPVSQGGGGKQFAFIRSTRGGTTGYYNQSDPNNTQGQNTLSQRYDDPYFVYNITQATANGMFAGPYHFGRPDIIETTLNSGGIANTGTDEANHMLEIAGPYMKPGYLLPTFDLEVGMAERTSAQLSQFAVDFSNRIFEVKGIRPLIYINQTYANYVNSTVPVAFPNLWIARWPSNPDYLNGHPPASPPTANVYGRWNPIFPNMPEPQPWKFWQYTSTGRVPGIGGGNANVDLNVAHGDIEFVKDFLVPALWFTDASGNWTEAAKWNSNPGLPGPNDRVIINRANANPIVTLNSGSHSIRSLESAELFASTGGTLNIQQYMKLLANSTLSGSTINAGSVVNNATLRLTAGALNAGPVTGPGSVIVSGGTFTASTIRQSAITTQINGIVKLSAPGTTSVSAVSSLTHAGGQIDIGDEAIVLDYTTSSPAFSIRTALLGGYNGGAWNGAGISSTVAAADPARSRAVGMAEAIDLFTSFPAQWLGETIDSTTILIRHTLYGDANLDGSVNIADFSILAAAFNFAAPRWSKGDFNFDGQANLADFSLLAAQFNQSLPADAARPSIIPEPAWTRLLLAALLPWRCRARRPGGQFTRHGVRSSPGVTTPGHGGRWVASCLKPLCRID